MHQLRGFEMRLTIRVLCPRVEQNQRLYITGNCDGLGNWNPQHAPVMRRANCLKWEIRLDIQHFAFPLAYKFVIADEKRENCQWEIGDDRLLSAPPEGADDDYVLSVSAFRDSRPAWKCAGTVIPVFSLRTEQSFGAGDFHDLKMLIDWAVHTHQRVIQVLPMNDTVSTHTSADSYPYNTISIHALHPLYISLSDLGELNDKKLAAKFLARQKQLNAYRAVQYTDVMQIKMQYCREFFEQEKEQIFSDQAFQSFCHDNRTWLEPYAAFCFLRDKYRTSNFKQWRTNADYHAAVFHHLLKKSVKAQREIPFICFVQFALHTQFQAVADYARAKGVILKGDLPIGISRTGVEAWTEPAYFNLEQQTGAPPDFFSATGQNWSFPTYNWDEMEKDGYAWWKKRFQSLSMFFDCLRIDHILGFFRIWEIPLPYAQGLHGHFNPALPLTIEEIERAGLPFDDNKALFIEDPYRKNTWHPRIKATQTDAFQRLSEHEQRVFQQLSDDFFYRRHNDYWKSVALKRLTPLVDCTDMLICGEDLGMIPATVPEVLDALSILSLELERTPKAVGITFTNLQTVPYLSVCTTSTHDMEPLRAWWMADAQQTQHYYRTVLNRTGEAPALCTPDMAEQIILNHLNASSMLTIIPLQDWIALSDELQGKETASERINIPENPDHVWDYRMHIPLEQLLQADELNQKIRTMIESADR